MGPAETLREALHAIRAHTLRSFLTLLGIIIGVATLVGVVSVISGLNRFVMDRVIQLGPDVFMIDKYGITRTREELFAAIRRKNLDWNDYLAMARNLRFAEQVGVQADFTTAAKVRERRLPDVGVHGTSANLGALLRFDLVAGRYFTEAEDETAQAVAVIGWDVQQELFPGLDPLGRTLLLGGVPHRVIGLLARQGRTLGESRDGGVYVPIQSYRRAFGIRRSLELLIRAKGGAPGLEASVDEARALLRALRHTAFRAPDPFGVLRADNLQELWKQTSEAAFSLSFLVAAVALGVGGIVIANIMLVAVAERTREIGTRLAVGARKRDIRRQFLLEATLLSLAGGLAGVLLSVAAAFALRGYLEFPAEITPASALLGLLSSAAVGIAAGYWPARSASNLPVIEALRAE